MTPLCTVCFGGSRIKTGRCDECGAIYPRSIEWKKLWLWKNGDHYIAFDHEFPTFANGDPQTLGEPAAIAILRPNNAPLPPRKAEGLSAGGQQVLASSPATPSDPIRDALVEIAKQELSPDMSVDQQLDGDFEGAYNSMIECARKALSLSKAGR